MASIDPIGMPVELLTRDSVPDGTRDRRALQELERVFLKELLKEMRASIPESEGMFKKSHATRMFEDMMYDVFAGKMAESGQLGIADTIQAQIDAQEAAQGLDPSGSPDFLNVDRSGRQAGPMMPLEGSDRQQVPEEHSFMPIGPESATIGLKLKELPGLVDE